LPIEPATAVEASVTARATTVSAALSGTAASCHETAS